MWYQSHLKARDGDTKRFTPRAKVKQLEIPYFLGRIDPEAYLQWEEEIELIFSLHQFTEEMKVRLAATGFSGYAIFWWDHIETTKRRQREPQISSWFEMKTLMKKRFVPAYFRRDLYQKMRRTSPGSRSEMDCQQEMEPLPIKAILRDQTQRRTTTRSSFGTPSKPSIFKDDKSGGKQKKEYQTVACNQRDKDLRSNPVKGGEDGVILISLSSRDVEDSIQQIQPGREGDIRPVNQAYQPNQEELSHDSTFSRNLTHKGITRKKNRLKSFPYEEDMQLRSRRTCQGPEREQRLFNEVFRLNQDEPSCKSTCFGNLTHYRCTENWNHLKIPYGLKVIQLLNQEMPGLPYLQAHGFNQLQTRIWRPGDAYNHSQRRAKAQKAQEDIKDELGLLMDEPNKMWVEQGPYWPMKLKDRPPWASIGVGRGLSQAKEEEKRPMARPNSFYALMIHVLMFYDLYLN